MRRTESGTVIAVHGATALVRLSRTSACAGCPSAGQCHPVSGGDERRLEVRNDLGAVAGDTVRVSYTARAAIGAALRKYYLPVAGLILGAGAAQILAVGLFSAETGDAAAGFGGIAGAILGALLARREAKGNPGEAAPLARITRIVADVDSPANPGYSSR